MVEFLNRSGDRSFSKDKVVRIFKRKVPRAGRSFVVFLSAPIDDWRSSSTGFSPVRVNGEQHEFFETSLVASEPEVVFVRSLRARNYRLTLRKDGVGVVTIPNRGSEREAKRFVEEHQDWLERARKRQAHKPRGAALWTLGTHVLWRGEMTEIRPVDDALRAAVWLMADVFRVPGLQGDLRPTLEAQFVRRGKIELPARTWELAAKTNVNVKQVKVRNQRSRWGSCSAGGTISLNWRIVQTPDSVRDYIIYHELMHLREMNHSARFWKQVAEVCPWWVEAERWLKRNGSLLGL